MKVLFFGQRRPFFVTGEKMIRITLSDLISSSLSQNGVNELAMKIGQIQKLTPSEMDQALEKEYFVAKKAYSRKSRQTDRQKLQETVQIIRKVRNLIQVALQSILKKGGVIRKHDDKQFIKQIAFHFTSLSNYENNFTKSYTSTHGQKSGQYCKFRRSVTHCT